MGEMTENEPVDAAEEAFAAYLRDVDAGTAPDFETWVARFPEHEAELRHLHRVWVTLAGLRGMARHEESPETLFHRRVEASIREVEESAALAKLAPGMVLDDFRLVRKIAQGGMGQVWEALQTSLDRPVAMKFLRPDRTTDIAVAFFAREGRAGGRLSHPGIVTIHATGESDGVRWIAQELVPGRCTLRDFVEDMRAEPRLPPGYHERLARFFIELADAMQFAHDAGVVHRDLKPQNILVTPDDHPKVTDFGLARLVDEAALSGPLAVEGTPNYMSPEQVSGNFTGIDPRTDVFSLGVVLYEVLTLKRPFDAETPARLYDQILDEEPADPRSVRPRVPEDLAVICLKALEKRRDDRYPSMRELGDDLRRYLADEPVHAQRPGPLRRARKWARRHPAASTGMVLGVALLGAGAWAASELRAAGAEALRQKKANLVIQADYAIENAQLDRAQALMDECGELDPRDALPHLVMARGYSQHLRFKEAEDELAAAHRMGFEPSPPGDGADAREHYLYGLALVIDYDRSHLEEAVRQLEEAIRLDPQMRPAYFPLYQLHKERGELAKADAALADFQQILATGDDYYGIVGAMRAELAGDLQEAIDLLLETETRVGKERAVELRVNRILGRLYLQRALASGRDASTPDMDTAEDRLKAAVDAVPDDVSSWANLGTLALRRYWLDPRGPHADEHLEAALAYGRRAIEEYPKVVAGHDIALSALVLQATRAFNESDHADALFQEAKDEAETLRVLDPEHPTLGMMQAQIAFYEGLAAGSHGDASRMEQLHRESIALNPDQVLAYLWLAPLEYQRGEFDAAFEHLRKAREVRVRFADDDAIRSMHPALVAKLCIWTFGAASHVQTEQANEVARSARADLEALLDANAEVEPIELLNWAEFLATSPSPDLRDCAAASEVLDRFRLEEALAGTPYTSAFLDVEGAVRDCE